MNIIARIRAGRARLPKGIEPDFILLGNIEHFELSATAVALGIHSRDLHVDGIRVVKVEEPQHLSFGIEPS